MKTKDPQEVKICMIIGDPVSSSLSPLLHNSCYKSLGIEDQFVYKAEKVPANELEGMVKKIRDSGIRGVSCTMPHKVTVMQYLDKLDTTAQAIAAVNTVVNEGGTLTGYNTDWLGILVPLEKKLKETSKSIDGVKVAILGAGGAAMAAAYALHSAGADFTVFNRTVEKARALATQFDAAYEVLEDQSNVKDFGVIINTTSVGMNDPLSSPISIDSLHRGQVIFDTVYSPSETLLIQNARLAGASVIYGIEMLVHQAAAQFELYTGLKAPVEVMYKVLNHG